MKDRYHYTLEQIQRAWKNVPIPRVKPFQTKSLPDQTCSTASSQSFMDDTSSDGEPQDIVTKRTVHNRQVQVDSGMESNSDSVETPSLDNGGNSFDMVSMRELTEISDRWVYVNDFMSKLHNLFSINWFYCCIR